MYVIFLESKKTILRNPWLIFLGEFLKCCRIFNITRCSIPYVQTKITDFTCSNEISVCGCEPTPFFYRSVES